MKKSIFAMVLAVLAVASVCAGGKKEATDLVVSTWGLSEDSLWSEVYEPLQKQSGITVVLDTGNAQERYTKMVSDPNSTIDIIELAQKNVADGVAEGVFSPIKPEEIKEFNNLIPAAQALIKSGAGVPYTINSIGIIYDEKACGMKISEWKDLWNPALKGKIAIPAITTTFGPAVMCMASDVYGVDITTDKGETAFKALADLKPNVMLTYSKASDAANLLKTGEVAVAIIGDFGIPVMKKADPDAQYVVPASCTYANFNVININKNTKKRDAAIAYINYRMAAETEERTAVAVNDTPVNTKANIAPELAKNMTVGDVAKRAKMVDFNYIRPLLSGWVERFNKLMNQ